MTQISIIARDRDTVTIENETGEVFRLPATEEILTMVGLTAPVELREPIQQVQAFEPVTEPIAVVRPVQPVAQGVAFSAPDEAFTGRPTTQPFSLAQAAAIAEATNAARAAAAQGIRPQVRPVAAQPSVAPVYAPAPQTQAQQPAPAYAAPSVAAPVVPRVSIGTPPQLNPLPRPRPQVEEAVEALAAEARNRKGGPKQIQSLIRSGLAREDVALLTGETVANIERFEGPILAEREYMLSRALGAFVPTSQTMLGDTVNESLSHAGAQAQRWMSWRDHDMSWVVHLSFSRAQEAYGARWKFNPTTSEVSALDNIAANLTGQAPVVAAAAPEPVAAPVVMESEPAVVPTPVLAGQPQPMRQRAAERVLDALIAPSAPAPVVDPAEVLAKVAEQRRANELSAELNARAAETVALDALLVEQAPEEVAPAAPAAPEAPAASARKRRSSALDELIPTKEAQAKPRSRRNARTSLPAWEDLI